ncbi:hypothetical protein GIB67_019650 [Kingdonia uniflora]|uniref:Glycosyltransferase 2-like domain-containing protein n=1 Tax=Kingdonia uniflora TaxID=39325 RepID=A0A7J7P567_9MAGN|nr:hypothetical protein GIB67_019650 [Kingdonia uniflora]
MRTWRVRVMSNLWFSSRFRCIMKRRTKILLTEVYEQSISVVCQMDWPKDHFLVQILDDSDDESIQWLIKAEVSKWSQQGINIIYRHCLVRTGYKFGNLKYTMSCDYVKGYEFVAIFDVDFQPNPDFLKQTVPHFKDNPELGLVQA